MVADLNDVAKQVRLEADRYRAPVRGRRVRADKVSDADVVRACFDVITEAGTIGNSVLSGSISFRGKLSKRQSETLVQK
jgi:hypothetical protein